MLAPIPLCVGYVGFGMGLMIALCFLMSGVISPILWSWFGNKLVIGRATADSNSKPSLERVATAQGR